MNDCDLFFTETLFPWLKDFGFDSHFRTSRNNVGTWYSDTPNWHATRQDTCAVIRHSIWHTDTLIHWCFDSVGVRYLQKLLNLDYGRIALGLAWLRTSSSPFDTDTAKHFWSSKVRFDSAYTVPSSGYLTLMIHLDTPWYTYSSIQLDARTSLVVCSVRHADSCLSLPASMIG